MSYHVLSCMAYLKGSNCDVNTESENEIPAITLTSYQTHNNYMVTITLNITLQVFGLGS